MKLIYDPSVDSEYIQLTDSIYSNQVKNSYPCNPVEVKGEINLDFDESNKLIGIEVMDASKKLPQELLDKAEIRTKK